MSSRFFTRLSWVMSAPAIKFFPVPVSTTAFTWASSKASLTASREVHHQLRRHLVHRWIVEGEHQPHRPSVPPLWSGSLSSWHHSPSTQKKPFWPFIPALPGGAMSAFSRKAWGEGGLSERPCLTKLEMLCSGQISECALISPYLSSPGWSHTPDI